ncbi:ROK family transcriptional regulator [Alicyclobacillus sp.]|uniref:ROK family transcriptional regulator n=1 Tax=Alicyclobacillus sp. TaxID=61169 RepID=UPI0025C2FEF6|nr:ROK family transcriptional regulator [Alicyclobacillus sp.]MCL6517698.1 ROK family transcriptional regulator [Alicyclobacillus sp.]
MQAGGNRSLVLETLRRLSPCSRADLRQATGLHISTVANIVDELIQADLVEEVGTGDSSGGRKPQLLRLKTDRLFAVSAVVQYGKIEVGLCDMEGVVRHRTGFKLPKRVAPEDAMEQLSDVIDHTLRTSEATGDHVLGVAVAVPGPLDADQGVLLTPPNLPGWRGFPIRRTLQNLLRLPVAVQKDGHLAAFAEVWFGRQHVNHLLFIMLDEGLGGGLVMNGQLVTRAVEIGHMTIRMDGKSCNCGGRGCLELYASGIAWRQNVAARKADDAVTDFSLDDLLAMAEAGDADALGALEEVAWHLGVGIGNFINLYNPEVIVLGGRLGSAGVFPHGTLLAAARQYAYEDLMRKTAVETSALKSDALLLGAAAHVFAQMFQNPAVLLRPGERWANA